MKLLKKKKKEKEEEVSKSNIGEEEELKKKKTKKPAEGSRYASVVVLVISVLISLGFYLYGLWSQKGINFEVGEMESTWEFEK